MHYGWQQGDQEGGRRALWGLHPPPEVPVAPEGERGRLPPSREKGSHQETPPACLRPTYAGPKRELSLVNESAARSLEEGLEQTLTLHRLGLFERLGRSLKTTNTIESIMALTGQRTDKTANSDTKGAWNKHK